MTDPVPPANISVQRHPPERGLAHAPEQAAPAGEAGPPGKKPLALPLALPLTLPLTLLLTAGRRRSVLVGLLALGLVAASAHVIFWGNHTARQALQPSSVEEGASCQLRDVEGRKPVECALLVARSADSVWQGLTSREPGPLFDSWLGRYELTEVSRERGGRARLRGQIVMWLRTLPVDVTVVERASGAERSVSWESAGSAFEVNRGGWSVTAVDPAHALVRYTLDLELPQVPPFVLRAILHDHLGRIVEAVVSSASDAG